MGTGAFGLAFGDTKGPDEADAEASGISGSVSWVGEGLADVSRGGAHAAVIASIMDMTNSAMALKTLFFFLKFRKIISITILSLFF